MLALENPHCGISGVPFMNSTTGLDATAWTIAALVWVDKSRDREGARLVKGGLDKLVTIGCESRNAQQNLYSSIQHLNHRRMR